MRGEEKESARAVLNLFQFIFDGMRALFSRPSFLSKEIYVWCFIIICEACAQIHHRITTFEAFLHYLVTLFHMATTPPDKLFADESALTSLQLKQSNWVTLGTWMSDMVQALAMPRDTLAEADVRLETILNLLVDRVRLFSKSVTGTCNVQCSNHKNRTT